MYPTNKQTNKQTTPPYRRNLSLFLTTLTAHSLAFCRIFSYPFISSFLCFFHMNFTPPASTSLALIMSICVLFILLCTNSSKTHKPWTHSSSLWSGFAFKETWSQQDFDLVSLRDPSPLSTLTLSKVFFILHLPEAPERVSPTPADSGSTKR